jgi:hypothetical protein
MFDGFLSDPRAGWSDLCIRAADAVPLPPKGRRTDDQGRFRSAPDRGALGSRAAGLMRDQAIHPGLQCCFPGSETPHALLLEAAAYDCPWPLLSPSTAIPTHRARTTLRHPPPPCHGRSGARARQLASGRGRSPESPGLCAERPRLHRHRHHHRYHRHPIRQVRVVEGPGKHAMREGWRSDVRLRQMAWRPGGLASRPRPTPLAAESVAPMLLPSLPPTIVRGI